MKCARGDPGLRLKRLNKLALRLDGKESDVNEDGDGGQLIGGDGIPECSSSMVVMVVTKEGLKFRLRPTETLCITQFRRLTA